MKWGSLRQTERGLERPCPPSRGHPQATCACPPTLLTEALCRLAPLPPRASCLVPQCSQGQDRSLSGDVPNVRLLPSSCTVPGEGHRCARPGLTDLSTSSGHCNKHTQDIAALSSSTRVTPPPASTLGATVCRRQLAQGPPAQCREHVGQAPARWGLESWVPVSSLFSNVGRTPSSQEMCE